MDHFPAIQHHDVVALLVQVATLLLVARGFGELSLRAGQPSVLGEIFAGILLGPSMLSGTSTVLAHWMIPQSAVQGYLLQLVSLLGAMFLLLITGLETDLALIRRHARTALGVSAGGIVLPFASGLALGQALPDDLLVDPSKRLLFSLFIATAMSISAIPVIAKVLMDLNLMRRDIGQAVLAAGMIDDTTGWILLSVVVGLAGGEAITFGSVGKAVGTVLGFLGVSFTAGRWIAKRTLDFVQDEVASPKRLLTTVVAFAFAWGAITEALGLEAVLGALVTGIVFGQMRRLPGSVREETESIALAIFAPVFFALAGLRVNVVRLLDPRRIVITLVVIAIATGGKIVGGYLGARLVGRQDRWSSLSFGAAINARGAMEIIIATIGLSLGILGEDVYSMIVLMAIATSFMAPPMLRWALGHVRPGAEEERRLRQEELTAGSPIASIHRVLLPIRERGRDRSLTQSVAACLLRKMAAKNDLSVTLLTVVGADGKDDAVGFLDRLDGVFAATEVNKKVIEESNPARAILDEAQKDYDLLVLGVPEPQPDAESLFTPLIDYVTRAAPCSTMIVQGRGWEEGWEPRRILVPTNGSVAAKRAAELAFALASSHDQEVTVLNVVVRRAGDWWYDARGDDVQLRLGIGHQIVDELRDIAEARGVRAFTEVRTGKIAEAVILEAARRERMDLIVVGTDIRPGSDRLFLGPRVERVLADSPCPVVVVNTL